MDTEIGSKKIAWKAIVGEKQTSEQRRRAARLIAEWLVRAVLSTKKSQEAA